MITNKQYIDICKIIAESSYSKRSKVGCIIVKNNNIISFSYNGTPHGFLNYCEDVNGDTLPEVLHAESNAITKMAKSHESCESAVLYTTMSPCFDCAKLIIQAGIKEVVYSNTYRDVNGLRLLDQAGIKFTFEPGTKNEKV